jgi:hypothetical protein
MNIPGRLTSDRFFRWAIILGVVLVLGGSMVSQLLMQLGGGPRHEPHDYSSQLPRDYPEGLKEMAIFPDGLPPFISSGGLYYPDKAVFDVGLGLGGLVLAFLAIELLLRTRRQLIRKRASIVRQLLNLGQLMAALLVGGSLVMITRHPFDESFLTHLSYANKIFVGSLAWGGLLILARGGLDRQLTCCRLKLNLLRWILLGVGIASYFLMTTLAAQTSFNGAALFEWLLTISTEMLTLSLLPILAASPERASEKTGEAIQAGRFPASSRG